MPFRPENRFTTFLVAAVLLLCGMGVWCVKVIANSPNPNSTPAWAFAGGFVLLAMKILVAMMQSEFARRELRADLSRTRHEVRGELQANSLKLDEVVRKTNGGLSHAVREAGEQARQAEREQIINDPQFREDLARDLCPLLAKQIAAELRNNPNPPKVQT